MRSIFYKYPISELGLFHYAFHKTFFVGGAIFTLDHSKEMVNYDIRHTNNKSAV